MTIDSCDVTSPYPWSLGSVVSYLSGKGRNSAAKRWNNALFHLHMTHFYVLLYRPRRSSVTSLSHWGSASRAFVCGSWNFHIASEVDETAWMWPTPGYSFVNLITSIEWCRLRLDSLYARPAPFKSSKITNWISVINALLKSHVKCTDVSEAQNLNIRSMRPIYRIVNMPLL